MKAIKVTATAHYANGNTEVIEFASKAECKSTAKAWGMSVKWYCNSICDLYE